mmetsp:Transcript_27313/g.44870  ORF Transcript_27313/g.44870 Transcript_27313/m.44870 type:complete len:90 (-) Transcript_27313:359-628(-)
MHDEGDAGVSEVEVDVADADGCDGINALNFGELGEKRLCCSAVSVHDDDEDGNNASEDEVLDKRALVEVFGPGSDLDICLVNTVRADAA